MTATQANDTRGRAASPSGEGEMTLIEHLAELRMRLLRIVLSILLGTVIGFALYDRLIKILVGPYKDLCETKKNFCITSGPSGDPRFIITDPLGGFATRLRISGYVGILIAIPVILWQVWRFIAPGLLEKEKKYAIPFMVSSMVLFCCGAGVAWWTFPKALTWLVDYSGGATPLFEIGKYAGFVALLMLGYGIGFLFPVILVTMQLIGVVTWNRLAKQWRIWVVGCVAIGAVVTPGGDPVSMIVLSSFLAFFYAISIAIGWLVKGRRAKAA
jgi:sec-independent protein translocase protein TatC